MVQAVVFRPRLYGAITEPPPREEIDKVVASAVALFAAGYGTSKLR
ncbi:MAG TPA: TetR/AcrR family transcriptional regulator C-terminal domain-containing protein [Hyphomicrobium sp.]